MPKNSVYLVFSVMNNIKNAVSEEKNLNEINPFGLAHHSYFLKIPTYIRIKCQTIYNDIENNYYTYNDLMIYFLYGFIFRKNININELNGKHIILTKKLLSTTQLEKDKLFIREVNKKLKLKDPKNDFFRINEDGDSIIYNLILKKHISPIFFIEFYNKTLTNQKEDAILNTSKDYKKFIYLTHNIKNLLFKEDSDE